MPTPPAQSNPSPAVGPGAAWGYLRLAAHALLGPFLAQLPRHGTAMRSYLLYCVATYGLFGDVFLSALSKPVPAGADAFISSHLATALWGGASPPPCWSLWRLRRCAGTAISSS
jgi:hypothetical protein